jgi:hypothetical protein
MRETRRFGNLIQKVESGSSAIITLSQDVTSPDDIEPMITYLVHHGIPRGDIRIRFPSMSPDQQLGSKLSMGLVQSGLNFGADVAEQDSGLARYFITTPSYLSIQSGQRHLVIGPKGSGKSAILRELTKHIGESLVITPEHYATDVLDAVTKTPLNTELTAYITTWKYTLLIEIFRCLVQTATGDATAIAEIRKYLGIHGLLGTDLSLFERFVGYLRRITRIRGKIGPTEAEIGLENARELEKLFKLDELLALVPALRRVLRRKGFTVLIDELDQSWNNSETANQFLIALLTAAIQLRGIDPNLHVVVFLRSEIFDLLKPHIAQLDKLRSDIEEIRWSPRELRNLIVTRAFDSVGIYPERARADAALASLFPGVIPASGVSLFDYILSRTSYRPREVIQFCNLVLKLAIQLDLPQVSAEAVLRAEEEFSVWKQEYIVSENLFIYPRLDVLLERFRGKLRRLTLNHLDSLLTEILLESDSDEGAPGWLRGGMEPTKLLELLYRLEVVGIEKPSTAAPEGRIWEGYDFVFSRPKARPEQSSSFLFHPGLWRTLELT